MIELVRVALNGRQQITSKAIAISLKLVKKDIPTSKMVVSFADEEQNHKGIIYQTTNCTYVGDIHKDKYYDPHTGKETYQRSLCAKYGTLKGCGYRVS